MDLTEAASHASIGELEGADQNTGQLAVCHAGMLDYLCKCELFLRLPPNTAEVMKIKAM